MTEGAKQTGKACGDTCSDEDAQPASLKERGPLPQALSSALTSCGHSRTQDIRRIFRT